VKVTGVGIGDSSIGREKRVKISRLRIFFIFQENHMFKKMGQAWNSVWFTPRSCKNIKRNIRELSIRVLNN
jgi:hypothetical protein